MAGYDSYFSVDEIIEEMLVLSGDDGTTETVLNNFDFDVFEGLILKKTEYGFVPDLCETKRRRNKNSEKLKRLLERRLPSKD